MKPTAEEKIIRYLGRHPSGLSTGTITAWIESCRRGGGYTFQELQQALYALRDSGRVAVTNKLWWLKDISTTMKEAANERKQLSKQRRIAKHFG